MPKPKTNEPTLRQDPRILFLNHVGVRGETECWPWTGAIMESKLPNQGGYGRFTVDGASHTAHRWAYLLFVDRALPSNLDVHHTCENRSCVNWLQHLEATDRQRHLVELTPTGIAYINKRKTHCVNGHEFTPENTAWQKSKTCASGLGRYCRTCRNEGFRLQRAWRRTNA